MENLFLPLLFLLIVLGAALEIISLFRSTGKVEFDYSISAVVSEPEMPIEVTTTITNKSILPISYLSIKETFPSTAILPSDLKFDALYDGIHLKRICRISSRSRKKIVLKTSLSKRGVYAFRATSMEIGDFLGFKELEKDISNYKHVVIYPKRYECDKLIEALSSFQGDIVAKRYLIRDPILTAGIREYTGREPMREIHWAKSAQQCNLMVREFDYNRQLSVNVLLCVDHNWHNLDDKDDLDKCCSAARTICETLVAYNIQVGFFTNANLSGKKGQSIWKCDVTAQDTQGLLETLGRVTNHARSSLEELLEYTHRTSDPASVSVLISSKSSIDVDALISRFTRTTGREVHLMKIDHPSSETEHEGNEEESAA